MRLLPTAIFCVFLASCASNPSPEDKAAFRDANAQYEECLGRYTATFINGSDDVAFLTKHISEQCTSYLQALHNTITSRGFSNSYADGYVLTAKKIGERMTASFILDTKSKAKKQ